MRSCLSVWLLPFFISAALHAAEPAYTEQLNVSYAGNSTDAYTLERCKLDLYLPAGKKDFPTVVWFHGGGLESGNKDGARKFGRSLAEEGIALVAVNYRLSPKVVYPAYIDDAALASVWVLKNIAAHGGDPARVFISGHSAGGYLALMLALDESRFAKIGAKPSDFPGYIPISGQTVTHFTIRKEKGLKRENVTVDEGAPLRHVRKDIQPMLLITAERETEWRRASKRTSYCWRISKPLAAKTSPSPSFPAATTVPWVEKSPNRAIRRARSW